MLIGGVSASDTAIARLSLLIQEIRDSSTHPQDSLQWKHITHHKLLDYHKLIDLFCELNSEKALDFTAAVFDTHRFRHHEFNEGDEEVAYQKFLGSLFLGICRKYEWPRSINCYHGQRSSRFALSYIQSILNGRAAKRVKYNYMPFSCLEYRNPSTEPLLQMNDVLLGAVAFHWNAGMRKHPNSAKTALARYAAHNCCAPFLGRPTPFSMQHFDIWEFKLR